jgi:hypothetical protein
MAEFGKEAGCFGFIGRQKEVFFAFEVGVESAFAEARGCCNLVNLSAFIADSRKDLFRGGQEQVSGHGGSLLRLAWFSEGHARQDSRNRLCGMFSIV